MHFYSFRYPQLKICCVIPLRVCAGAHVNTTLLSSLSTFRFPVEGNWFSEKRLSKGFSAHRYPSGLLNCKNNLSILFCLAQARPPFCAVHLVCYYTIPISSFWWGTVSNAVINEANLPHLGFTAHCGEGKELLQSVRALRIQLELNPTVTPLLSFPHGPKPPSA